MYHLHNGVKYFVWLHLHLQKQMEGNQSSVLGTKPFGLKVGPFGFLSGPHQAAMYCDWLSRQGFANQNKMLPETRQGGDQMVRL